MKLRQNRYKPTRRKNRLLNFLSLFVCVAVVVMWVNSDNFGLDFGTMLIYTGLGLMVLSGMLLTRGREKQLKIEDEYLDKLREQIGKDDGNSIFFDDK